MTARKPSEDVTRDWQASQDQKSSATSLRLFALLCWAVAIGGEIAGIVLFYQHKFDHGNLPLLIGLLVGIAVFAIAGNLLWKAANRHDPASQSDTAKFFFQNQLGAIITLIAFLPLLFLILSDKDMDPQTK
jgi:Mn2+/Fe2+ NRAMP family transporter